MIYGTVKFDELPWNPQTAGQSVRLTDNPGRRGTTTGKVKIIGNYLMVEVDFGPNDAKFKHYQLLELIKSKQGASDLLSRGRFGGPIDLRRLLTFEKIKGELTNVFYSMEASNTDFYPHQFKSVLKFIESPFGRLLIADEVGLGKTIESIYIWKELQARHDARRLLIVCPAMLREKWQNDLKIRFNMPAEVVDAKRLLESLSDVTRRGINRDFTYIISLESLRPPPKFEEMENTNTRSVLARLLYENIASDEFALFDFVIIDEAHYLRNPSTQSNRLGRLLRESARYLVLLTATPIQIHSENLYQLLRLIDPNQFYDKILFGQMLSANSHVVDALRCLWRQPPQLEFAAKAIDRALSSAYFKHDDVLQRICRQVQTSDLDLETRVELARMLETRSLLSHYMVRNRKKEVREQNVKRAAQVLNVSFCQKEREIYEQITEWIKIQTSEIQGAPAFAPVMRQRQMASSLVATLERWAKKETGSQERFLAEFAWEDSGRSLSLDGQQYNDIDINDITLKKLLQDLKLLEEVDSKYAKLKDFLIDQLKIDGSEKFVVFAYFRDTLKYLQRRLEEDHISTALIMGGMRDRKYAVLQKFSKPDGPSVLLSSEVGSEGIDLQFCRFIVNYDLPWNPMRVEQRIGRLDRLGQKSERISIINLVVDNTIEDRILHRLFERIHLFESTIGDLEEILGGMTNNLILELLNPILSEREREKKAEEVALAIEHRKADQERMEQEAVNLVGFSDYILDHIKDSRDNRRWLGSDELISLVDDFFKHNFTGTKIEPHPQLPSAFKVRLSPAAKASLNDFLSEKRLERRTRLHQLGKPILCLFDPREVETFGLSDELIEPTHPLIQWIRANYEKDERQIHPVAAIQLDAESARIPSGDYAFAAHRWSFNGLRKDQMLAFRAVKVPEFQRLNSQESEHLITVAAKHGNSFPNAAYVIEIGDIMNGVSECEDVLEEAFGEKLGNLEIENQLRCEQQKTNAQTSAARKVSNLQIRLERFRAEGKHKAIPMTEGLLRKEEDALKTKLAHIEKWRNLDPTLKPLVMGVIRVR